jgi:hypothetical protein
MQAYQLQAKRQQTQHKAKEERVYFVLYELRQSHTLNKRVWAKYMIGLQHLNGFEHPAYTRAIRIECAPTNGRLNEHDDQPRVE